MNKSTYFIENKKYKIKIEKEKNEEEDRIQVMLADKMNNIPFKLWKAEFSEGAAFSPDINIKHRVLIDLWKPSPMIEISGRGDEASSKKISFKAVGQIQQRDYGAKCWRKDSAIVQVMDPHPNQDHSTPIVVSIIEKSSNCLRIGILHHKRNRQWSFDFHEQNKKTHRLKQKSEQQKCQYLYKVLRQWHQMLIKKLDEIQNFETQKSFLFYQIGQKLLDKEIQQSGKKEYMLYKETKSILREVYKREQQLSEKGFQNKILSQQLLNQFGKTPEVNKIIRQELSITQLFKQKQELKKVRFPNQSEIAILGKFIEENKEELEKNKKIVYRKQWQRILSSKSFDDGWYKSMLKKMQFLKIQKSFESELTSRVKLFRHIFLTELITCMILNQFGIRKHDNMEQRQKMRRCGSRFFQYQDYPNRRTIQNRKEREVQKKKTEVEMIGDKIKNLIRNSSGCEVEVSNFILINEKDKSLINKKRYCLHQMAREADHSQALINFVQLVFSSYGKDELMWPKKSQEKQNKKSMISHFMQQCKTKRTKRSAKFYLREYTRESFFHKILNIGLRVLQEPDELNYLRQPFFQIFWSIKTLYRYNKFKGKKTKKELKLYRGCSMSKKEIMEIEENSGGFLELEGFISTTLSKKVGLRFSKNVLLEIIISFENLGGMFDNGFASIRCFSVHTKEEEVLVNAFNSFKILKLQEIGKRRKKSDFTEGKNFDKPKHSYEEVNVTEMNEKDTRIIKIKLEFGIKKIEERVKVEELRNVKRKQQQQKKMNFENLLKRIDNKEKTTDEGQSEISKRISKWDEQIVANCIHQEKQMATVNNYGQLLMATGNYDKAVTYFRRMLKQISRDKAIQGWQWRKSPCLVEREVICKLSLVYCYEKKGYDLKDIINVQTLMWSKSSGIIAQNLYVELLNKFFPVYKKMGFKYDEEECKRELRLISAKQEAEKRYVSVEEQKILALSGSELEEMMKQQRNRLQEMEKITFGKESNEYLEEQYLLIFMEAEMQERKYKANKAHKIHKKEQKECQVVKEGRRYLEVREKSPQVENIQITEKVVGILMNRIRQSIPKLQAHSLVCEKMMKEMKTLPEFQRLRMCLWRCLKDGLYTDAKKILDSLMKAGIQTSKCPYVVLDIFMLGLGLLFSGKDTQRKGKFFSFLRQQPLLGCTFPDSLLQGLKHKYFKQVSGEVRAECESMRDRLLKIHNYYSEESEKTSNNGQKRQEKELWEERDVEEQENLVAKYITAQYLPTYASSELLRDKLRIFWHRPIAQLRALQQPFHNKAFNAEYVDSGIDICMCKAHLNIVLSSYLPQASPPHKHKVALTLSKLHLPSQSLALEQLLGDAGMSTRKAKRRLHYIERKRREAYIRVSDFPLKRAPRVDSIEEIRPNTHNTKVWKKTEQSMEHMMEVANRTKGFLLQKTLRTRTLSGLLRFFNQNKLSSWQQMIGRVHWDPHVLRIFQRLFQPIKPLHRSFSSPFMSQPPTQNISACLMTLFYEQFLPEVEGRIGQEDLIEGLRMSRKEVPLQLYPLLFSKWDNCKKVLKEFEKDEKQHREMIQELEKNKVRSALLERVKGRNIQIKILQPFQEEELKKKNEKKLAERKIFQESALKIMLSSERLRPLLKNLISEILSMQRKKEVKEHERRRKEQVGIVYERLTRPLLLCRNKKFLHEDSDTPRWWSLPSWDYKQKND